MKLILTQGYFLNEDEAEKKIMKPYPPLGILYISAYLNQHGIENEIFDTTFSTKTRLINHLKINKPDILAIYVNLMTKLNVLEIIKFVKSDSTLSNTKIILGGPEVRYNAEEFLKHGADFVVIGEGEQTALELITILQSGKESDFENVEGIGFIKQDGKLKINKERALISNIDQLPFPNRKGIDIIKYQQAWKNAHKQDAISVSTMRGCPYTCRWCSRAVYGLTYRRRSPAKVVEELLYIKDEYNPDTLWFVDDVFTISHKWLAGFEEELKKANLKINYECITRADRMNLQVVEQMKRTGCFRVWIGAESGSQRIIDAMNRRVKVQQVREMIKLAKENGIETGTFIMLGYPGETEADIEETINHLKISNPDYFTITTAYPIKGTEFFQEVEAGQQHPFNWEKQTDRERAFKRTYPTGYYHFAVRRVVNEVKFHKALKRKNGLSELISYKTKSLSAKAAMFLLRSTKWLY